MVWTQSTGTPNILAQRFQANGDKAGDVITVSPAAGPTESQPDVAAVTGRRLRRRVGAVRRWRVV